MIAMGQPVKKGNTPDLARVPFFGQDLVHDRIGSQRQTSRLPSCEQGISYRIPESIDVAASTHLASAAVVALSESMGRLWPHGRPFRNHGHSQAERRRHALQNGFAAIEVH